MFPDVLGYWRDCDLEMVLPASPVCCESEFCVSDRCAQALIEASTIENAAATGHPMGRRHITCLHLLQLPYQIQTRA
jgi:hypothetical protein